MAMPARPALEQHIRLDAIERAGRLAANRLVSTRSGGIASALAAHPVEQMPRLLTQLFPLCGMAHGVAGLTAIEQALDIEISPAQAAFRELVVLAEHGAALGWRISMDWPPFVGAPPDLRACGDIRRAVAAVTGAARHSQWLQIGGAALRLDRTDLGRSVSALAQMLTALFPEAADPAISFDALETALQTGASVPARLIQTVRSRLPADYGCHDGPLLAARPAEWFAACLATDAGFSDAPTLDGRPAEVGPLAAQRHPLAADAVARWGASLAARLLAAALDGPVIADRLRHIIDRLTDDDPPDACAMRAGRGAGVIETARGPLAYYVQVEDGRVRILRNVAPTEWNFHPQGPFVAALEAAPRLADPAAAARLLAASFDPCVPFDIALAPTREAIAEDPLHA
ncbi:MAG: nickel-dependent hydrogenase large subunit [Alphaproteobacteria bacterium]|nr:nickel-dependent hydrogenase large subunit [Alphaproteobacteria bacterium]